ncbi:MAG: formylmethanofuran dehydrogenase subunit C [Candidatus Thiodiazotropha sp. (ex Ctena orbiculata)]|nr:formylmethanofuran dehydrogenase subunit C [Candidatus Thiodiazotropha taylori]MBT3034095.1 formylmethanofuran dehydrogenase subunit C [Candidatus Thiodiazotropha taylori]PUB86056.1 MAG: formylmethanofuran dehydrogenase subunit C [gamma proteobacterium symbiont of Ctena orbiculata]
MSTLSMRLRSPLSQRIDMSPFTPRRLAGRQGSEIARIPIWLGNRQLECGELFEIDGVAGEEIIIQSESDRLDRIGAGMDGGIIRIEGDAGAYLGRGMHSGSLLLNGNAGSAAGCAMRGGLLRIEGNAGDFLGGAITGERQGMRGGTILLKGNSGDRAGDLMRRGMILIEGDCGDYCASRMIAGTLFVNGQTGSQTGYAMRRGTLITTRAPASMPASFNDNGLQHLNFLTLLGEEIQRHTNFSRIMDRARPPRRWLGDLSCDGKGEILFWD